MEVVEILVSKHDIATILADRLRSLFALEHVLAQILLWSLVEHLLEAVEAQVEELLGILLHSDVRWCAAWLLKSKTKLSRVVIFPVAELQEGEHLQPLVELVVVDLVASVLVQH